MPVGDFFETVVLDVFEMVISMVELMKVETEAETVPFLALGFGQVEKSTETAPRDCPW